jgi:hypothetical protein
MTEHVAIPLPDETGEASLDTLMHALAERMQASGNYLRAARHLRALAAMREQAEGAQERPGDSAFDLTLAKAEKELSGCEAAYRSLRARLSGPKPQ